jgi:predicted O-methyltransferase YrrM
MEKYIENTSLRHLTDIKNVMDKMIDITKPLFSECNNSDTTGFSDCSFLSMLIMEYKPKTIMEIGTWVGTTSYTMATTSNDVIIYTCDNNNRFVNLQIEQCNRIKIHPNTHSTQFLKRLNEQKIIFDMIFNDASLSDEDCNLICELSKNEFIFVTHDYYNSEGGYEKGYYAMESMKNALSNKNILYKEYIPKKEWYFKDRINACCGLLICNK